MESRRLFAAHDHEQARFDFHNYAIALGLTPRVVNRIFGQAGDGEGRLIEDAQGRNVNPANRPGTR
jgi:hypothetical protein